MTDEQLEAGLDLMRRLPPQNIIANLAGLIDLVPALKNHYMEDVDQPLKLAKDKKAGDRPYILSMYNCVEDSYRSPWSNEYDPPTTEPEYPSEKHRCIEERLNEAFDIYRELYFEGGVSSVYVWDSRDHSFAVTVLIKKVGSGAREVKGCWDSIHVVEVTEKPNGKTASYKLVTTVMLWLETYREKSGMTKLGGTINQVDELENAVLDNSAPEDCRHLANIGRLIEDMENRVRAVAHEVCFGRTNQIFNELRSAQGVAVDQHKKDAQEQVADDVERRNSKS
eukprot:m.20951 g.20951  ORF g.20951 m.20951 type:complete len:281 (+) comp6313_c0_seq1:94-936(+)